MQLTEFWGALREPSTYTSQPRPCSQENWPNYTKGLFQQKPICHLFMPHVTDYAKNCTLKSLPELSQKNQKPYDCACQEFLSPCMQILPPVFHFSIFSFSCQCVSLTEPGTHISPWLQGVLIDFLVLSHLCFSEVNSTWSCLLFFF